MSLESTLAVVSTAISGFVSIYGRVFTLLLRDIGFSVKVGNIDIGTYLNQREESVDDRLKKIEVAKSNLQDALEAMDELGLQAASHKREFEQLKISLVNLSEKKLSASAELDAIRDLAKLDTGVVQRALGVPSKRQRWAERAFSFVLGFAASFVASIAYEYWLK